MGIARRMCPLTPKLEPPADADIRKEPSRLLIHPKADAHADFQVRREQTVQARTDELLREIVALVVRHLAEILDVARPAFAKRNFADDRRRPDVEMVAPLAVFGIAHRR